MAVNDTVDEDDVDENTLRSRPGRSSTGQPKRRRVLLLGVVSAVLVLVLVVLIVVIASGGSSKKPAASPSHPQPTSVLAGYTTFRDTNAGYAISYPATWPAAPSSEANIALQATMGTNPLDTMLIRDIALQSAIDTNNVNNIKAVTDAVISGTKVNVLKQQPITVNSMPGYYYFYSLPRDPTTGTTLVHSHFFVFPPHEMVSLVFQTTDSDFAGLAPMLDKVVASVTPLATATTPTSAASSSSTTTP